MRFPENNVRKRAMIFFSILNAPKVRQFEIKSGLKREGTKKNSSLIFLLIYVAISYLNNDLATI